MMNSSSSLQMNPVQRSARSRSSGGRTLPASAMLNPQQQVMAQNGQIKTTRKHHHQQALYGPPVHYAQTVSRATNLHLQQLMRSAASNSRYLTDRFHQYSPATMSPQDRNLFIHQQKQQQQQQQLKCESLMSVLERQASLNRPLCRCRVMYLGSSVPHITKNGLHGIQEPLRHLYPEKQFSSSKMSVLSRPNVGGTLSTGGQLSPSATTIDISHLSASLGIDSWLSVWSNGLLLENIDEFGCEIKRFFSIESLHYCAAVRFFDTSTLAGGPDLSKQNNGDQNNNHISPDKLPSEQIADDQLDNQQGRSARNAIRFLPLDAPLFQCPGMLDPSHPPVFAAIMRRTTGIKVLECHAFICRRDAAANALVRCCTHSYADFLNAKRLSIELCRRQRRSASCSREIAGTKLGLREVEQDADEEEDEEPTYELADVITGQPDQRLTVRSKSSNAPHSTGTSNETDNSLEASSEDNYAIISKHYQPTLTRASNESEHYSRPRQHHLPDTSQAAEINANSPQDVPKSGGSTGKRRKQDRAKGLSTRSLFDDFMPQAGDLDQQQQQHPTQRLSRDAEQMKLSHSLDMLESSTCCARISDGSLQDGELVEYSVVGKTDKARKRYSKSMQNLEGPLEFSAAAARDRCEPRQRGRRGRNESRRPGFGHRNHKAASYQDMVACGDFTCPALAVGSVDSGAQEQQVGALAQETNGLEGQEQRLAQVPPVISGSRDRRFSVKSRRSRSKHLQRDQQQSERGYEPLPPAPLSRHQLTAAPYAAHLQQRAYYPAQPLGLYPPAFALPGQLPNGAGYHHPMPCYLAGGAYPPPAALYPAAVYEPSYLTAPFLAEQQAARQQQQCSTAAATTKLKHRKPGAKSSLATRFRCLSPPVNFLTSRSRPSSQTLQPAESPTVAATNAAVAAAPVEQSSAIGDINTNRDRAAERSQVEEQPEAEQIGPAEPSEVISGQPGFISHSAVANGQRSRGGDKKLGWMKRLSLTMSGSSALELSEPMAADDQLAQVGLDCGSRQQRPKKRSSLFFGSLTLGRSSKPKLAAPS